MPFTISTGNEDGTRPAPLDDVLVTAQLAARAPRSPDLRAESRAFRELSSCLASNLDTEAIFQKLTETILSLCGPATTAGICVVRQHVGERSFHWCGLAGELADQLAELSWADFSHTPCDVALASNAPQLFRYPGRHYVHFAHIQPAIVELLIVPFNHASKPIGSLVALTTKPNATFNKEDCRLLTDLSTIAGAGQRLHAAHVNLDGMQRLQDISSRLVQQNDIQPLLDEILDAALQITGAPMGNMQLVEPDTGDLILFSQRGFSQEFVDFFQRVHVEADTTCGQTINKRTRVLVPDIDQSDLYAGQTGDAMRRAGALAVQSTPMVSRSGRMLGVLSTHWSDTRDKPSNEQLRLLDLLIRQAADLLERTQAEKERLKSEHAYRTLFNSIDEAFCVIRILFDEHDNPVDYLHLEQNQGVVAQTGLQDVTGKTARELVPDLEDVWIETYASVARTRQPTRFSHHSEAMGRWFNAYAFPVDEPETQKVGILFRDVSEQKEAERQLEQVNTSLEQRVAERTAKLREREQELAHVGRLGLMGEMAAGIAHELNQPLSAVCTYAEGLLANPVNIQGLPPQSRQALKQIRDQAQRAGRIIRTLRDFVRKGDAKRETAKVNDLVREVTELTRSDMHRHGIDIQRLLENGLPDISVAPVEIEQVLINLLHNAAQAMDQAGSERRLVAVRTERHSDEFVHVTVHDTGPGLEEAKLDRIFEPFYTSKDSGLGIGLNICQTIIESHDGRIWARRNVDGGLSVHMLLPTEQAASPDHHGVVTHGHGETIARHRS